MATVSERISYLMEENHYSLEELCMRAGLREEHLAAILAHKQELSHQDAVDLSRFLGADASYLEGREKAYYLAYRPIRLRLNDQGLSPIDIHEQLLIPGCLEVMDFTCILYERKDEEWGHHDQQVLLVSQSQSDGYYLVEADGQIVEATQINQCMYRHHQLLQYNQVLYKIEAFSLNLEDLLRKLTHDIQEGTLEFTL